MNFSIVAHKSILANRKRGIAAYKQQLDKLAKKIKGLQDDHDELEMQIKCAEEEGRSDFDSDKYKKRRKV